MEPVAQARARLASSSSKSLVLWDSVNATGDVASSKSMIILLREEEAEEGEEEESNKDGGWSEKTKPSQRLSAAS